MKPAYHKTKESFAGMAQTTMQQKRQLLCWNRTVQQKLSFQ
jgi:hypothetical protein